MSLLWPKPLLVGLFPQQSWMQQGRRALAAIDVAPTAEPHDFLLALHNMLAAHHRALARHQRIDLVVSDSLALVTAMPWQEQLRSSVELQAYGAACLELTGTPVSEQWVMQTTFRQYAGAGMAYALPQAWLRELLTLLSEYELRLRSVLPISAAAFWRQRQAGKGACDVLLLSEARRVSALTYTSGRLAGIDVEPIVGDPGASAMRLLTRIASIHTELTAVHHWIGEAASMTSRFPDVPVYALPRDIWS